jgi:hypothetical protein
MKLTRRGRVGIVIAVAYVLTTAATLQLTTHRIRPLYEGFTPPPPYNWVNPPSEFRAGNQKPPSITGSVRLTPTGSAQGAVNTDDAQLSLNLPAGAFAAHPPDVSVAIRITPLDPAGLGPLPPGLVADGNAYRVEATYTPSNKASGTLAKPGDIFLTVPQRAISMLFSPDGKAWQGFPTGDGATSTSAAATFDRPGYFLAASPPGTAPAGNSSDTARIVLIALLTVTIAVGLILGPRTWRRLRRQPPATPPRRSSRTKDSPRRRP